LKFLKKISSFPLLSGSNNLVSEVGGGEFEKQTLKDVYKNYFHIGVALSLDQIMGKEPKTIETVEKHFNSITPENILKWEEVHPEPNRYNFEAVDRFVEFGEKNKMHIIGHTLVWFLQTPEWVFYDEDGKLLSREGLLERMRDHIFTIVGRYKGRIHGWDVVNEAVANDGQLRKSKWFEILGEDHIIKAFEYAHEADPNAELYYNEYDYEVKSKCDGVINLIKNLQSKGVSLNGVGIQGHWFTEYPCIDDVEKQILALSSLGIDIMITELDVSVLPFYPVDSKVVDISSFDPELQKKYNPYPDALTETAQRELANRYANLFSLFLKHRDKISRVTFWALHDAQSWRNYIPIRGRKDYPMLFDHNCEPKLAFDAVIEVAKSLS
jgi:endo-1,4-beta-xylanase